MASTAANRPGTTARAVRRPPEEYRSERVDAFGRIRYDDYMTSTTQQLTIGQQVIVTPYRGRPYRGTLNGITYEDGYGRVAWVRCASGVRSAVVARVRPAD